MDAFGKCTIHTATLVDKLKQERDKSAAFLNGRNTRMSTGLTGRQRALNQAFTSCQDYFFNFDTGIFSVRLQLNVNRAEPQLKKLSRVREMVRGLPE